MAPRIKVLLYESMHREGTELLEEKCDLIYAKSYDEKDLLVQAVDVDAIIIRANGSVSEKIIDNLINKALYKIRNSPLI